MWRSISLNSNNIDISNGRSVLVKMPDKSQYKDFKFWHPSKLIREKGGFLTLSYTDDFAFKLFKNGSGKYNSYEKISEMGINSAELESAFGQMNEAIDTAHEAHVQKESQYSVTVEEPDSLLPTENRVDEDFII